MARRLTNDSCKHLILFSFPPFCDIAAEKHHVSRENVILQFGRKSLVKMELSRAIGAFRHLSCANYRYFGIFDRLLLEARGAYDRYYEIAFRVLRFGVHRFIGLEFHFLFSLRGYYALLDPVMGISR